MTTASVTEFKANVSTYLRQVEAGEEVFITHHGRVKARVIPEGYTKSDGLEFMKKAKALREKLANTMPKDDWTIKDYISHGRR